MSNRTERPTHKRSKTKSDRPIQLTDVSGWLLRIYVLLLTLTLPWYFGCATWLGQYYLFSAGIGLVGLVAFHCLAGLVGQSQNLEIPWLTWVFLLLAAIAFAQTLPVFSWDGKESFPASVPLQKWALGLSQAPEGIQTDLLASADLGDKAEPHRPMPLDLNDIPESDRKLTWSIEPLHTRGALPSLVLCGLLVWIGRMVFSDSKSQLWLFAAMTLAGTSIAAVGINGSISYKATNFLGLQSGQSFATFQSKNSAGGYYNICIAGSLGLLAWTLLNTRRTRSDVRYRFPDSTLLAKIRGLLEDLLADLNTPQIASMLCLVSIVSAMVISLCRGAAVSALAAIIVSSVIANARNRNSGSWVTMVAIAIASIALLVGFQLDDQAYSRLESISEVDLEQEFRAGRAYIWSTAWKAMNYYGLLGSGLGTFHFAYLPFQNPNSRGWFYHAESLYAQCGVELGYIGLSLLLASILFLAIGIQSRVAKENWRVAFPSKLAGGYLLFSQALHSFVDFAIILPALFVPSCLLMGSVGGLLASASKVSTEKKNRGVSTSRNSESNNPTDLSKRKTRRFFQAILGVSMALTFGIAFVWSIEPIASLARVEELTAWQKIEERKPLSEQSTERTRELAAIWSKGQSNLQSNSNAMLFFGDSLLFDYRINQLSSAKTPGPWEGVWGNTSPLVLYLRYSTEPNILKREEIIASVGGAKSIEQLKKSASWYAKGQTKSPLDWRLAWGRCLASPMSDRKELLPMMAVSNQLGRHKGQQLLAATLLFRPELTKEQMVQMWYQAMKSDIGSYLPAASLIANETEDGEVPVDAFPQLCEVLENIAKQVFKKETYPLTNKALWERAKTLAPKSRMSASRREIWLATAASQLGDSDGEIVHLQAAIRHEPNNIRLMCQLADRQIDRGELGNARTNLQRAQRLDPLHAEVRRIAKRISDAAP